MSQAPDGVVVTDDPDRHRYVATVDGAEAGRLDYRRHGARITLVHTEVDDAYAGRGVGGALAKSSLDAAREAGATVVPTCPFVQGWLQRHPDYQDLVAS